MECFVVFFSWKKLYYDYLCLTLHITLSWPKSPSACYLPHCLFNSNAIENSSFHRDQSGIQWNVQNNMKRQWKIIWFQRRKTKFTK